MSTIKLLERASTKFQKVGDTHFAYRELGDAAGVPVIFLNHLAAVLDNWDPRVVDGIAAKRRVIVFDNRGIGASEGATPDTIGVTTASAREDALELRGTPWLMLPGTPGAHIMIPINK